MRISRQLQVNAPSLKVWQIIANDYEKVGNWASAVQHSNVNKKAKAVQGAPVGGRVCETDLGPFEETIEVFDANKQKLVYSAKGKSMPFFVKSLRGNWQLTDHGDITDVNLEFNADLLFPFSVLMGWMMKIQFKKAIDSTLEELIHYAETDTIHPRKLALVQAAT